MRRLPEIWSVKILFYSVLMKVINHELIRVVIWAPPIGA